MDALCDSWGGPGGNSCVYSTDNTLLLQTFPMNGMRRRGGQEQIEKAGSENETVFRSGFLASMRKAQTCISVVQPIPYMEYTKSK